MSLHKMFPFSLPSFIDPTQVFPALHSASPHVLVRLVAARLEGE